MKKALFKLIFCATALAPAGFVAGGCTDEPLLFASSDAQVDVARHETGGNAGSGGSAGSGGVSGNDASPNDGAAGSPEADVQQEAGALDICLRWTEAESLQKAREFPPDFLGNVRRDCRVTLLTFRNGGETSAWANQLIQFNQSFWGCNPNPLTDFSLAYNPGKLTAADVAALIEVYMRVAIARLDLSTSERVAMQAALTRLGQAAVTSSAAGYSFSNCDAGTDASAEAADAEPTDAEADVSVSDGAGE